MKKGDNCKAFYRIPKYLFSAEYNGILSSDAKLLYALILDRASLSLQNGWLAEDERVFIYFTVEEAMKTLSFGKNKIIRLFKELEKTELIERVRTGLGKASVIYLPADVLNRDFSNAQNKTPESSKNKLTEASKPNENNTEYNNNETNNTYLSQKQAEETAEKIKEQIEYDIVICLRDKKTVDEIITVMTDTLLSSKKTFRINGSEIPFENVSSRLLSLDSEHIQYAVDVLDDISGDIKNIRGYILSVLYNAPATMDTYYQALYNKHHFKSA